MQLRGDDDTIINTCPRVDTVLLSLLVLLTFLVSAVPAVIFPTISTKHFIIVLNVTLASLLGMAFIVDVFTSKHRLSRINVIVFI
jgi:hypothetical protein